MVLAAVACYFYSAIAFSAIIATFSSLLLFDIRNSYVSEIRAKMNSQSQDQSLISFYQLFALVKMTNVIKLDRKIIHYVIT